MFKRQLFGYSVKQVDALIHQMENEHHSEAENLNSHIGKLEEACRLLQAEIETDKTKLKETKEHHRILMNALVQTFIRKKQ